MIHFGTSARGFRPFSGFWYQAYGIQAAHRRWAGSKNRPEQVPLDEALQRGIAAAAAVLKPFYLPFGSCGGWFLLRVPGFGIRPADPEGWRVFGD